MTQQFVQSGYTLSIYHDSMPSIREMPIKLLLFSKAQNGKLKLVAGTLESFHDADHG